MLESHKRRLSEQGQPSLQMHHWDAESTTAASYPTAPPPEEESTDADAERFPKTGSLRTDREASANQEACRPSCSRSGLLL